MAKLLVNISIPAISESYDLRVPDFLKIRTLVPMIVESVVELSAKRYVPSGEEYLCVLEQGRVLSHNHTVAESGIKNGDHLYLF